MEETSLTKIAKSRRLKMWAALFVMIISVGGGYKIYNYFKFREQYQALQYIDDYVANSKSDIYGGATPEETLKMFVDALKAGDVEKASLYFVLDMDGSRGKWLEALKKDKEDGNLKKIIDVFTEAELVNNFENKKVMFRVNNDDGTVGLLIVMLNNGNVWKIESL